MAGMSRPVSTAESRPNSRPDSMAGTRPDSKGSRPTSESRPSSRPDSKASSRSRPSSKSSSRPDSKGSVKPAEPEEEVEEEPLVPLIGEPPPFGIYNLAIVLPGGNAKKVSGFMSTRPRCLMLDWPERDGCASILDDVCSAKPSSRRSETSRRARRSRSRLARGARLDEEWRQRRRKRRPL